MLEKNWFAILATRITKLGSLWATRKRPDMA